MVVWFEANREGRISAASSAPKPADTSATLASERLEAARVCGAVDRVDRSPLYALGALTDVRANVDAAIGILVRQLRLGRPPASWEAIGSALGISSRRRTNAMPGRSITTATCSVREP
jgi:hypothetical protein